MDGALALALTLQTADWAQTRTIARDPMHWSEMNPVLGRHPSIGRVNTYFLAATAAQVGLHYALPQPWRQYHAYAWIAVEGGFVAHNAMLGVRMSF